MNESDARVRRSRASLRSALLRLLKQYPLERITSHLIADAAGVGSSTFYRHYSDKQALLRDVATQAIDELAGHAMFVHARADTFQACVDLCQHVAQNRSMWRTILSSGAADVIQERLIFLGSADARERSPIYVGLPPELSIALATRSLIELLNWWLNSSDDTPPEAIAFVLNEVTLKPLEKFRWSIRDVTENLDELMASSS